MNSKSRSPYRQGVDNAMTEVAFLRESLQGLHTSLDEALKDLSQEQAHWRPNDKGNHIAFIAWHYARTVDNIVRFVLQQRRPTLWMEGKWDERFGLDSRAQGTGMSPEDAANLRISDLPAFCGYMSEVWKDAQAYLATVKEEDLDQKLTIRPMGEVTQEHVLGNILLTHGHTHLGEIWTLKGQQGLQGSPL